MTKMQPVGVLVAFAAIMVLSMKRVKLSGVMLVATVIMVVTSGLNVKDAFTVIWKACADVTTLELVLAVLSIGLFSTTMKELGYLEKAVAGLSGFLGNVKAAIMAVPALIGTMPVHGGAALSAPLVDRLGDSLDLEPDVKASANLVFRHGMFFLFPFSTSLILTSKITGFSIPALIANMWPMSVTMWGAGYIVFLRKPRHPALRFRREAASALESERLDNQGDEPCGAGGRFQGLSLFLKYGGPLLLALLLGLALKWPLWIALLAGTGLAAVLGLFEGKPLPRVETLYRGANLEQVLAMFFIMVFKEFVAISPVFPDLVAKGTARGISPALMALALPLVFGYGSASHLSTIGVLFPILLPHALTEASQMAMVCLMYSASFVSYFVSPLHLCQILTCQYFDVDMFRVYKLNWPVYASLGAVTGFYFLLLIRIL